MALARDDVDAAIRAYSASVTTWPENHAAWYYLAYAQFRKGDPAAAAAAAAKATRLAPAVAMYRLMRGVYLHEAAVARARAAQAGRLDLRTVNQDAALAELDLAVHLDARLWRAHYYRGRILRDRGDAGPAAEALTSAVRNAPPMSGPYVALAELYRRWDHLDPAIAVARLGASHLAGSERADVLYVLGLAHEGKREDVAAREAYTKALDARPGLAVALFQRGQVLARLSQPAAAKADLEAFVAHPDAPPWEKSIAQRLLFDLAQRKR
ncbi:MAG TPA: tetratricopeptide repeat protein, partial [Kofleriaceae bacterium]|nr:tetratricopeptide repeat protein [Kofleriaceae bacterium]